MDVIDRRGFVLGAAAVTGVAARGAGGTGAADGALAYDFGLPLFEMHATRRRALAGGQRLGRFAHARALATARSRAVTTPNADTLYSSAWLDLAEPVEIVLPRAGDRYFSLALMDAWTNHVAVLGDAARTGADRVVLVGPDWTGRSGPRVLRSPTRTAWALARVGATAVDVAAAHAVQDQLGLSGGSGANGIGNLLESWPDRDDMAAYFAVINRLMTWDAPLPADGPALRRLSRHGVGPGLLYRPGDGLFETAARAGLADLRADRGGRRVGGWLYPRPGLGRFGTDYPYRAETALTGLAALPVSEAAYLKPFDGDTLRFDGRVPRRWRIAPGGAPPVRAGGFWSLTIYEETPDGQLFLYDNPDQLFAVGDRTPGVRDRSAAGLDVVIAHERPTRADETFWLPAPAGAYHLQLRLFRPAPGWNTSWRPAVIV